MKKHYSHSTSDMGSVPDPKMLPNKDAININIKARSEMKYTQKTPINNEMAA